MILSDLPSPAEASSKAMNSTRGFAQAGNRFPPRIKSGAGFFGIMLYSTGAASMTGRRPGRRIKKINSATGMLTSNISLKSLA
jgi:hypothetical protein